MGDQRNGGIAWTEQSWNPLRGCSRVSEGCRNCYAERVAARFSGPGQPYEGLAEMTPSGPRWTGVVRMVPEHLGDPLRWRRPRLVFVNSMSDLFHGSVNFPDIAAIFGVMAASPTHTFQVLTKRPERAREWFRWISERGGEEECSEADIAITEAMDVEGASIGILPSALWPLPNVWLGVSVEDQETADERVPVLLDTPAAVRWVSYEPALGPVDWAPWMRPSSRPYPPPTRGMRILPAIDWVVCGGESGPGARPFDVAWARSTIKAGREAGFPVFVKQLGERPIDGDAPFETDWHPHDRKWGKPHEWPEDLRVREYPKR